MPHSKTGLKSPQSQLFTGFFFCFRCSLRKWMSVMIRRTQVPKNPQNGRFADLHFKPRSHVLSETKPRTEKNKGLPRKPYQSARSSAYAPKAGGNWDFCGWGKFGDWVRNSQMAVWCWLGVNKSRLE